MQTVKKLVRLPFAASIVALVTVFLLGPVPASAGKPSGGGSGIKVEALVLPEGFIRAVATDIDDSGNVVVGWAARDTGSVGSFHGIRWTRASASDPWVAEDLHAMVPSSSPESRAVAVNNGGTILLRGTYSNRLFFVMTRAGGVFEFGPNLELYDLSETDSLAGYVWDDSRPGYPLPAVWASPSSPPELLPVLADGYTGIGRWFQGADVIGTAHDASGTWVVRWVYSGGAWSIHPIVLLPANASLTHVNSAGRISLNLNQGSTPDGTSRAAVWDPPYVLPPVQLPLLKGKSSGAGKVMEDGTVTGSSGGLPVIWPTLTSVVPLPVPSGAKSATPNGVNAYRQIAGAMVTTDRYLTLLLEYPIVWTLP